MNTALGELACGTWWVVPVDALERIDGCLLAVLLRWSLGDESDAGALSTNAPVPGVSSHDVIEATRWMRPGWPRLRLVVDGESVPPARYLVGSGGAWQRSADVAIDGDAVARELHAGAMLVLDSAEQYFPELGRYCHALSIVTGRRTWANLYLNANGRGFPLHSDDHDVLVAVTEGARDWTIGGNRVSAEADTWLAIPAGTEHAVEMPLVSPAVHVSFSWARLNRIDAVEDIEPLRVPVRLSDEAATVRLPSPRAVLSGRGVRDLARWPRASWAGPVLVRVAPDGLWVLLAGTWQAVTADPAERVYAVPSAGPS